jgi:hypothetical protein
MDVCRSDKSRWILTLLTLAFLLPGCLVNPVPTPATGGSLATADSGFTQNPADTSTGTDSVAAQDATSSDVGDNGGAGLDMAPFAVTQTDAAIASGSHVFAVNATALASGRLVVLLPDAGQAATAYLTLATHIAEQGHRVLVLSVPLAADAACAGDATCLDLARQEIQDGQDRTPKVTVTTPDCLQNRLVKALMWLDKARPGENWGKFYAGSTPLWSNILIAGHGEGASEAASVALHQAVWRVALLAGPTDGQGTAPASWLSGTSKSPATAWRGFAHTNDPRWSIISGAWTALGLGSAAAAVSVDGEQQPGVSVQLLTTAMAASEPHAAVAVDLALPTDPTALKHLRAAWKVLFLPY